MEITKFTGLLIGMVLIGLISIGGIGYQIYNTGEESTCRTNKPYGWNIIEEGEGFYEAECPYITKPHEKAYCSSFRSTASYERYGCNEVVLVEIDNSETIIEETVIDNTVTEETIIDNTVTEETVVEKDGDTTIYEGDTIIVAGPGQKSYVPYYEGEGDHWSCSSKTCVPCYPSPEGCIPIE